jgi:tetratricopeptide (TPR) repeat protein
MHPSCAIVPFTLALVLSGVASAADLQEIPVTTSSAEARLDFDAGQAALDRGDAQRANALFRSALEHDPEFLYALLNVANSSFSAQEFSQTLDTAKRYGAAVSEGERLLVDIALTFVDNDAEKRVELSRALVERYPGSPRAWLNLGAVLGGLNSNVEAREAMMRAEQLAPAMPLVHSSLGFSYLFGDPKDHAKAEEYMRKAVALAPGEDNYHMQLGDAQRGRNELKLASASYARAVHLDPSNSIALLKLAHINSFLGNYDDARRDYDRGIAQAEDQNVANYSNFKMYTWVHAGDYDAAIRNLGALAAQIDRMKMPEDQRVGARIFTWTNLAQVALHAGRYDVGRSAIAELTTALRANAAAVGKEDFTRSQEAVVAYWEGQLAAREGDYARALERSEAFKKLVEPDANPRKLENYHEVRGLVHLLQKDYARALEEYRQSNLNVMYNKYHLALALEGAGQAAEARGLFREVGEWNFNTVDYALVRRDALRRAQA